MMPIIPITVQLLMLAAVSTLFAVVVAAIKARHPAQFITWTLVVGGGCFVAGALLRAAVGL